MANTEFYCDASAGSNLNAGSTPGPPALSLTGGNWDGTSLYTKTGAISGVSAGDWASVFADGAAAPAGYVARVTATTANTITLSTTAKSGTAPGAGTGTRSVVVGGAWKGPDGASGFPFGFMATAMTNAAGDLPRVNLKNNAMYVITAAMAHGNAGPATFQGYSSAPGDGGRATIDGGTAGAGYVLLTVNAAGNLFRDLIFQNNGATTSANGVTIGSGSAGQFIGCVVHDVRGTGFNNAANGCAFIECEAYNCNQNNAANLAGFNSANPASYVNCIAHDNSGSNAIGFRQVATACSYVNCIADTNGADGFNLGGSAGTAPVLIGCEAYNNAGDGLDITGVTLAEVAVRNGNFLKNGGYGINGSAGVSRGVVQNCGFGAGTQANTSGPTNGLGGMDVTGTVTYAADVTPWMDPANGDFRVNLAAAKGAGRGMFVQTAAGYAGTVGYPDIGAAQHQESAGGGALLLPRPMNGGYSA